jgi:hypothetical protein
MTTNVSMSLEDFKAMEAREQGAYAELDKVRAELLAAKLSDPSNTIKSLVPLCREMLIIVRFAMANLPPMEIRGWPFEAVQSVANRLACMPDNIPDDVTIARELTLFAADVINQDKQHAAAWSDREAARQRKARIATLQVEANKAVLDGFSSAAKAKLLEIEALGR